jgi:hypothetical protein
LEPEVINLLLSVNRTVKTSPSITGERACGNKTRSFAISGIRFQQYRASKINDAQIISDLK